jgi:hypothetical protein
MSPEQMSPEQMSVASAFNAALADIRTAGEVAIASGRTDAEQAEAASHLMGLLSAGIDLLVHRADPAAPLLTPWMTETRKFFGDSPDTRYTTAPVAARHRYRLHIRPGNCVYWGVVVYARDANGAVQVAASLRDEQATPGPDGWATVRMGGPAPEAVNGGAESWLPLDEGSFWVMVREYFGGDDREYAELRIERTDGGSNELVMDPSTDLRALGSWIKSVSTSEDWLFGLNADRPNEPPGPASRPIPPELVRTFLPTPDIVYQGCVWQLADDEALVVRLTPPAARHWSFTAMNRWLESLDRRQGRNCLNGRNAVREDDGTVQIVVSARDPGHPNWLPTQGHPRGMLAYRALLPEGTPPPPQLRVQPVAELDV